MADSLWSLAVRADWNNCCAVCGSGKCEAHHLISRKLEATRYDLTNGIALCATHHQYCPKLSPHQNALGWIDWLKSNHSRVHEWYEANLRKEFTGTKTASYYCDVIRSLREYVEPEDFTRIVGQKFSAWLESES